MHQIPDESLVARSRTDPAAFVPLFERHFDAVHGYLRRRVGPEAAEELASEAFTQAFASRGRFDPELGIARSWLFGIATNLVRHWARTERAQMRVLLLQASLPSQEDPGPESAVTDRVLAPELAGALESLSAKERDVLLLHAWAELQDGEIAVALGIPIGTVKSRLSRARARVREYLAAVRTEETESGLEHREELL